MVRRCLILAWMLLTVPVASAVPAGDRVDPKNPPDGLFADDWSEVYLLGHKVGYAHTTMTRDGDEVRTSTRMKLRIERAGVVVRINMEQGTVETLDGVPRAFTSVMDVANQPTRMEGTIRDARVRIVTSQFGMEQTRTFDFTPGALMIWGAQRELLLRGFEPGTHYTLNIYSPDVRLDGPVQAKYRIVGTEPFEHDGQRRTALKVVTTLVSPMGELETDLWMDDDGNVLRAVMNMAGMNMEMVACDQRTAMRDFVSPEFFMSTVVPVGRRIDRPGAQRITYRVSLTKPGSPMPAFPKTRMQSTARRDAQSVELVVTRQPHAPLRDAGPIDASRVDPQYLESNVILNTDDPTLVALTRKAVGDATAPLAVATRLREFVTDYISEKSLGIGFATASEVARDKEGDCTEHAVLLAAMGRIAGLPSRVVTGLAYVQSFKGRSDIFGFHMWTQFLIAGRWVDFDAALRESECSPARIALSVSSLHASGLAELSMKLMDFIGRIRIEVLDVTTR